MYQRPSGTVAPDQRLLWAAIIAAGGSTWGAAADFFAQGGLLSASRAVSYRYERCMSGRQVAFNVPLSAGCGLCCLASLLGTREQCTHVQPSAWAKGRSNLVLNCSKTRSSKTEVTNFERFSHNYL